MIREAAIGKALEEAHAIITSERDCTVESATMPIGDLTTLDAHAKLYVDRYESALTAINDGLNALAVKPLHPTDDPKKALEGLRAFVGVMFGQGPDAIIPETVTTPIGLPVQIGALMRDADAVLTNPPLHRRG